MTVVVTGLSIVSALGRDTGDCWRRLLAGESAIALRQPFQALKPRPLAMLSKQPSNLDQLLFQATFAALKDADLITNIPAPPLRYSAAPPLPDASIKQPLTNCGIVISSSRGHQAQWEQFLSSGQISNWLGSLPHMGAIAIARAIGSQGPVHVPTAACATGLWAIAQGANLIRQGLCDHALVGAGEAPITPLALTGFEQMRAMASTGCYPFDERREGLALGEGAAVLVLEAESVARTRLARIYGSVLEAGLTADANHVSAPDTVSQEGGLAAIQTCLRRSNWQPGDISFVHAHGTGTRLNDSYEAALIQAVLPASVRVTATKGATGHTLGASGAIGAAVCLLALHHQTLPPCVGLTTPAFDLNLLRQAESASLSTALCFSFGFGGQNAVIAFKHY